MSNFLDLAKSRQSQRGLFDPNHSVPHGHIHKIMEAASWAPTAHNMQNYEIVLVNDRDIIDEVAEVRIPPSITFVRENYQQLSFSKEELIRKKTGILGDQFPPLWRRPGVTQEELDQHEENDLMAIQLKSTPLLGVVLYDPARRAPASEGDFLGIISLGCVMENMWLMASELGVAMHIVSSLSNGAYASKLKELLFIPEYLKIAWCFRLGYETKGSVVGHNYTRVRREVADFVYQNKYGNQRT